VPTVVLRDVTDRPEAEDAGIAKRAPPTALGVRDGLFVLALRTIPRVPSDCFGTADAARTIAQHLAGRL